MTAIANRAVLARVPVAAASGLSEAALPRIVHGEIELAGRGEPF